MNLQTKMEKELSTWKTNFYPNGIDSQYVTHSTQQGMNSTSANA